MDGEPGSQGNTDFQAKVVVDITWSRFRIKTVTSSAEREAVLRLRYDVFMRELLGHDVEDALDKDSFDDICDHLVIIERASERMVGTYRFIASDFSAQFYTETEFDLSQLLAIPGRKLEMGRACIHPDFRNGFTFIALWKGLAGYIYQHPVAQLFGCSSVKITDAPGVARILDYLQRHGHYRHDLHCPPLPAFTAPGLHEAIANLRKLPIEQRAAADESIEQDIPPLLWAYFDAGAKVIADPAYDADFACMDFLTVLDTAHLRDDLVRKYKPW